MIGSDREVLIDRALSDERVRRRGGPIAMLALLFAVWVGGRAVFWESPFAPEGLIAQAREVFAQSDVTGTSGQTTAPSGAFDATPTLARSILSASLSVAGPGFTPAALRRAEFGTGGEFNTAQIEGAHHALWGLAMISDRRFSSLRAGTLDYASAFAPEATDPFSPAAPSPVPGKLASERWSLDAWAFARSGSGAASLSQGRVPVYGASQAGAILQYRAAPRSKHDPHVYARAYRALIDRPESEIAGGISARPLGRVPVRIAAEVRAVDDRFRTDIRPAAYAVTEIPPIALPGGLAGEVYAGAGYVGGVADTAFVDGQANITRQVARFGKNDREAVRLTVGAGAWGGAQRDANRLDVGPTMRVDLVLGDVPARVSVDWRERVGGDASPGSGVAATISTRF